MEAFPSNSQQPKNYKESREKPQDKEKVEKVVTGEVIRQKKSLGKRFAETFTGSDAKSVWNYILLDVLVPAAKDMVADAVSQGVEKMIFGEARSASRRSRSTGYGGGHVNYSRYANSPSSTRRDEPERSGVARTRNGSLDFEDIVLETRVEAERVIDRMFDIISQYEVATVTDLCDLLGETAPYTDNNWGWTSFKGASFTRVRRGYLLDLPKPEPLN